MKEGKKCNKIVSLVLAAIMMVSVFAVSTPEQVQAAGELSFKGKGKSNVTIADAECYGATEIANFIKFKSNVTGYITVTISNNTEVLPGGAWGYFTFCNSKKKSLGLPREYFHTGSGNKAFYTRTYGIKKGSTYYFKVESEGGVKINATVTSAKKGSNNSKSKAKSLSKNKTAKGIIIAGEKKADWYKINVTKRQMVQINYNVKTNGLLRSTGGATAPNGIKIALYMKSGKPFASGSNYYAVANLASPKDVDGPYYLEDRFTGARSGINPGTYYIKVERYNKTSSGYYTIKWK